MDWSWLDEFDSFFAELGDFVAMLSQAFHSLPGIVTFVLTFIFVVSVVAGGLYMLFKVIG